MFFWTFFPQRAGYNDAEEIIGMDLERRFAAYNSPAILHITGSWLTAAIPQLPVYTPREFLDQIGE